MNAKNVFIVIGLTLAAIFVSFASVVLFFFWTLRAPSTVSDQMDQISSQSSVKTDREKLSESSRKMQERALAEFQHCEVVTVGDDSLHLNVWQDGFAQACVFAQKGIAPYNEKWDLLRNSLAELSLTAQQFLDNEGLSNVRVIVIIRNDQNTDKIILAASGGDIIVDALSGDDVVGKLFGE